VLGKGRQSQYSGYFDIRWSAGEPLMVPLLDTDLDNAIKKGIIKMIFSRGRFFFNVYEQNYPVNPASYSKILQAEFPPVHFRLHKLLADIPE
jgi:maltooligosyltrehalose synthase